MSLALLKILVNIVAVAAIYQGNSCTHCSITAIERQLRLKQHMQRTAPMPRTSLEALKHQKNCFDADS